MLVLSLVLCLSAADSSTPLSNRDQQRVDALTNDLNSPFCPGRTLATCPSPKAAEWRNDIRSWVKEGVGAEKIQTRLQERVPDFRLSARPPGAWSTAVPALVLAALTLAFVAVGLKLRPQSKKAPPAEGPPTLEPDGDSPAHTELRRQLAEMD